MSERDDDDDENWEEQDTGAPGWTTDWTDDGTWLAPSKRPNDDDPVDY